VCHPLIEGLDFGADEFCGEFEPCVGLLFAFPEPKVCQPDCGFACALVDAPVRLEFTAGPVECACELLRVRAAPLKAEGECEGLFEALSELCAFVEVTKRCEFDGAWE